MMSISKKWIFPVIGGIGILGAIIFVSSANPPPPIAQPVAEPAQVPFKAYIGGAGITEPNTKNIEIGTHIPGIVSHVFVQEGIEVKAGDPLFIIEDREAIASVTQATAMLTQAKAELANAADQYAIIANIKDKRAVSKDERNQKSRAVEVAKAKVESNEAALAGMKVNLDLHTVRAPSSGLIMTVNVRAGEFATSNGTSSDPLIRMGNIKPMHLRVDIDENDVWRFNSKAKAIAYVRGNPNIKTSLTYVRTEPYVRPKRSLTGDSLERVDTRVLQVIYAFTPGKLPIYIGQQMDVYIEATQ